MLTNEYQELIGMRLLKNIYDVSGTLLIGKGTLLRKSHLEKLANFKIKTEDVEVAETGHLVPKHILEIDDFVRQNNEVPMDDVEGKLLPFIQETAKSYNLYRVFSELEEQGDFRYKQSIGVALLATALGRRLKMDEDELAVLATAASLYDIGSVKLPSDLIHKPERFDTNEYAIMKQHTVLGYELLSKSDVDPRIALVALQHHEREDGSGYPEGLKGDQIDRLSKIVSLVDVYVALISDRPHRQAFPFFDAIHEIHRQIRMNRFDLVIGHTFLDLLISTQVGCNVVLSDGRTGKILLTNVNYPTQPLIVLDNHEFIDLSKTDHIQIKEVIG
ncbi:HD-GYP domain-containing protein [Paenibacillus sp. J22TS3]|uniref:HD-GYP domain-containing protein n=1 Tax=Paenibacillus sp. J22TS3 TaxID=2807192 RepID=UPI001B043DE5|nr:HD domain-containing phosphohydrolase [Paenibacillus sp. J22TS3]GIP21298.1 HD family phosphohydrolase [Paenibacillus sp. J22TS3]